MRSIIKETSIPVKKKGRYIGYDSENLGMKLFQEGLKPPHPTPHPKKNPLNKEGEAKDSQYKLKLLAKITKLGSKHSNSNSFTIITLFQCKKGPLVLFLLSL